MSDFGASAGLEPDTVLDGLDNLYFKDSETNSSLRPPSFFSTHFCIVGHVVKEISSIHIRVYLTTCRELICVVRTIILLPSLFAIPQILKFLSQGNNTSTIADSIFI